MAVMDYQTGCSTLGLLFKEHVNFDTSKKPDLQQWWHSLTTNALYKKQCL